MQRWTRENEREAVNKEIQQVAISTQIKAEDSLELDGIRITSKAITILVNQTEFKFGRKQLLLWSLVGS